MTAPISIAIDGPVASGKSTVGQLLADRLGFLFFDTGLVYRATAHRALLLGVDPEDDEATRSVAENLSIDLAPGADDTRILVNGVDVTSELRTPEIDQALPPISANPGVRRALLDVQREAVAGRSAVVVGRDVGTVILPDADLKIYLDAAVESRAKRRYQELLGRSICIEFNEVLSDLLRRDERDTNREHAPLAVATGAKIIDATHRSALEVVDEICALLGRRAHSDDEIKE